MATKGGRSDADLMARLQSAPNTVSFFQAVRMLEQAARVGAPLVPRADRPVGRDAAPRDEVVRFRASPSLTFSASEARRMMQAPPPQAVEGAPAPRAAPPQLVVDLMGLTGPSGVLPQVYTEVLVRSIRDRSFALRDFLDLFNHRTISLFYRAWQKYRMPFSFESDHGRGGDGVSRLVAASVGLAQSKQRSRQSVNDQTYLHYAGHFSHWPRSVQGLQAVLSDFFARRVKVRQFHGHWMTLAPDVRTQLPSPRHPRGLNAQLGITALAGTRVWDVQSMIRLEVGPLSLATFSDLLPGQPGYQRLRALLLMYLGLTFAVVLRLTIAKDNIPDCQLLDGPSGPRLGLNTWAKCGPMAHDASDAQFTVV